MTNLLAKTTRFSVVFVLLMLSSGVQAQSGEERTLTLDEVVQLGLANSKQVQIASTRADIAWDRSTATSLIQIARTHRFGRCHSIGFPMT